MTMEPCVVVVDDEPDLLELVTDILEEDGLQVLPIDRPERVQTAGHICKPDLVLMDLMLPGVDGIELARKLQNDGMRGIPMIAMSASQRMLSAATRSDLFEATLPKPFDLSTLLELVESHVRGNSGESRPDGHPRDSVCA